MQAFLAEAQAILRAHVLAIGGNALVSYQLNEIVLLDNPHKHQVSRIQSAFIHINALKTNQKQIASTLPFLLSFSLCTLNLLKNAGALRKINTTITYACPFDVSDGSIPKPPFSLSALIKCLNSVQRF